ncbi:MAG: hypothetical protein DWQ04_16030 [Chloroflexi bacterium]|nr:MAG: hypothetical protein DWQ04_16030 [Chloroflexota bacterium]
MQISKKQFPFMNFIQKLSSAAKTQLFQVVTIFTITLLGLAFRLFRLGDWSFWIDEIFSLRSIQSSLEPPLEFFPLSNIITGNVISILGINEWNGRIVPAIVGTITIPILYFIVKKQSDNIVAILSAIFLSVAPWHIYWSQNLRFYTFLLLLYMLALTAFYLSLEQKKIRIIFLILGSILLVLAIQERLFAVLLVPVFFAYLLLLNVLSIELPALFRLRNLIGVFVTAVILFVIYDVVINNANGGSSEIAVFFSKFVGAPNKTAFRFIVSYIYRVSIPMIVLGLIGGIFSIINKDRFGILNLCAALIPPLALTIISPFIFTVDRYAFIALPSWIILSAIAIKEAFFQSEKLAKVFIVGVFLLVITDAFSQNFLYYQFQNGSRPDWKTAFAIIEEQRADTDIIYATRPKMGEYYLDQNVLPVDSFVPKDSLPGNQKSWFVISTSTSAIRPDIYAWIIENGILIETLDVHIPGKVFDMQVYLYDPINNQ